MSANKCSAMGDPTVGTEPGFASRGRARGPVSSKGHPAEGLIMPHFLPTPLESISWDCTQGLAVLWGDLAWGNEAGATCGRDTTSSYIQ